MNAKESAKFTIENLVANFKKKIDSGKADDYNEEQIKQYFILPMFKALGWDITNDEEVVPEERASDGWVDYAFKINDITKFYIEAKKPSARVEKFTNFAKQAIDYALHQGISWVILTNFKRFMIFNAELEHTNPLHKEVLTPTATWDTYATDSFDKLWHFSKESMLKGELEAKAQEWGLAKKRVPLDEKLQEDLLKARQLLSKDIAKNNVDENLTEEQLDEAVQRFLDRILFIRKCEDGKQVDPKLWPTCDNWDAHKGKRLIESIRDLFRTYDDWYDSELFEKHLVDDLLIDGETIVKVISTLSKRPDNVHYNFSKIKADILGNAYEQYLGHILKKTPKRAKIEGKHIHRKEQGIYYTPTYIVDYIVKNTVGELLKDRKVDPKKIKILDPACGSGSFLINAHEYILKASESKRNQLDILTENIYGVDLDQKAVEIARLNLLLKSAVKREKLPTLMDNIKRGNSLIDDESLSKKAFNWDEKFKEIMKGGRFDIVIGNPPWISFGLRGVGKLDKKESQYYRDHYKTAEYKLSTYALFIERAIELLSPGGYFGFILPDSFLLGRYFSKLRRYILDTCSIKQIVFINYDVFSKKATTGKNILLILQKESDPNTRKKNVVKITKFNTKEEFQTKNYAQFEYSQKYFEGIVYNRFRLFFKKEDKELVEGIERDSTPLNKFMQGHTGVRSLIGQKKIITKTKKSKTWQEGLVSGSQIGRYWLKYEGDFINIDPKLLNKGGWDPKVILNDKIMIRQTGDNIYATLDTKKYYHLNNIHSFDPINAELSIRYLLAILNSRLISKYYQLISLETGRTMAQTDIETLEKLPIKYADKTQQEAIINLVEKILDLNKRLVEFGDKLTEEQKRLEKQIEETDKEIDELVYKIYGITEKEKKIIEESLER